MLSSGKEGVSDGRSKEEGKEAEETGGGVSRKGKEEDVKVGCNENARRPGPSQNRDAFLQMGADESNDGQHGAERKRKPNVGNEAFKGGAPEKHEGNQALSENGKGGRLIVADEEGGEEFVLGHFGVNPWSCHNEGGDGSEERQSDDTRQEIRPTISSDCSGG